MALNKITIAGTDYYEVAASFDPTTGTGLGPIYNGTYYATEPFGNPPYEGAPIYQDMEITLPGLDGVGIKRFGFRGRPIYVTMMFIGDDKTDAETRKNAFFSAVTPLASFAVQLPGGTSRPSCRIVHGSASSGTWSYMGGAYVIIVPMAFQQMRLT